MKRINEPTVDNWLERHAPIEASGEIPDGTVVDGWRVAALVARGGSGEVYRAVHAETGRVAAFKVLHRDDDVARARFALEISILSENRSPFLPAFYGAGEYMGRPWCAMEFLNPFSLPSGDGAVASFVTDVCRGVGELHAMGYVHRDIKPSNILSRNGEPVLIDLGLLKNSQTPVYHVGGTLSIVDGHPVTFRVRQRCDHHMAVVGVGQRFRPRFADAERANRDLRIDVGIVLRRRPIQGRQRGIGRPPGK